MRNGATLLVDALENEGVDRIFGVPGEENLDFLDERVSVRVNIEDVCNAFSDGTRINFFKSGSGCENTARTTDVVYHEYGHSIHYHSYVNDIGLPATPPDGAVSEGISDYIAATITGDPAMGRGFFMDASPLRDIEAGEELTMDYGGFEENALRFTSP